MECKEMANKTVEFKNRMIHKGVVYERKNHKRKMF